MYVCVYIGVDTYDMTDGCLEMGVCMCVYVCSIFCVFRSIDSKSIHMYHHIIMLHIQ